MNQPLPTLFSLLLRSILGAFLVFILVFFAVFALGFWLGRDQWQVESTRTIKTILGTQLDHLVGQGGRLEGEAVSRALMGTLEPTVYVMVFRTDGTLVFWSWRGKQWFQDDIEEQNVPNGHTEKDLELYLPPHERPVFPQTLFQRLQSEEKLIPLIDRGVLVGSFHAGHHSFELIEENLQFLQNLLEALVIGLTAAGVAAALFAWRAFQRSSARAGLVQEGLLRIASGRRDVVFPPLGTRELEDIAGSALKLQEALVCEQELRRRWAQDIAHDLRTPLAGLRVQLEGVIDTVFPWDEARAQLLLGEVARLELLTGDLLSLSRLESPEMHLSRQKLLVAELSQHLKDSFSSRAFKENRDLVWTAVGGEFEADSDLLYRALGNLLSNALNHARGLGSLEVSLRVQEGSFQALICNPGWLDPREEPYRFQRLHRGEAARSGHGHGLGLTIARTIAELHGGSLTLQNGTEGTVEARFTIPASS